MYRDLSSAEGLVNACRIIFFSSLISVDSYHVNLWTQDCQLARAGLKIVPLVAGKVLMQGRSVINFDVYILTATAQFY